MLKELGIDVPKKLTERQANLLLIARLEELGNAAGISVTDIIHDTIRNHLFSISSYSSPDPSQSCSLRSHLLPICHNRYSD